MYAFVGAKSMEKTSILEVEVKKVVVITRSGTVYYGEINTPNQEELTNNVSDLEGILIRVSAVRMFGRCLPDFIGQLCTKQLWIKRKEIESYYFQ